MAYEYDPDDKFGYKDTLPENHPEKVITGVEFDDEFKKIEAGMGDLQIEIDAIVDGGSIDEAPVNGLIYGRKDKSWVEVSGAGGGIEEAPETGKPYARKNKSWVESVENGHTHEIADIDGLQDAIDGLAAIDHTHEIEDVDGLNDALDNLAEKITAVTSDIVFGGTYDLANGVVLRSNKEFLVEGQPLPAAADAPDVFLIVTSDGTFEGEALIRSDWIVSDGVTWIPIPYSSTGSVSWENIVDKPAEFPPSDHNHDGDYAPIGHNHDADYAPIAHNHDLDYAPIDHNHDGDYQPAGDYVTEAPSDGKPYVRKDEEWHEMPSTGGGGDSLWQQNLNDIYYNDGNVGIGTDNPESTVHVSGPAGNSGGITLDAGGQRHKWFLSDNFTNVHNIETTSASAAHTWQTNGTESMRIDANGNVGIGTDTPSRRLTVSSSSGVSAELQSTATNSLLAFQDANTDIRPSLGSSGNDLVAFTSPPGMQSTERMRIDANGNVGIGTDNPANNGLTIQKSGVARLRLSQEGVRSWDVQAKESSLTFHDASANNTGGLERMRIDADGNVGIGTDSVTKYADADTTLEVKGKAGAGLGALQLSGADSGVRALMYAGGSTEFIINTQSNHAMCFNTNNLKRMTIDANGRVGINTDAPEARLHIRDPIPSIIFDDQGFATRKARLQSKDANLDIEADYNDGTDYSRIAFRVDNDEKMRLDYNGRLGIGGEPGTRAIDEAKALAKTKLTEWKAEVKKRTAEQPEASTQEITLEVTDGDFGVMPTEEALAEFLQERNIGGGNAKLQVDGDGFFKGDLRADGVFGRFSSAHGLSFAFNTYPSVNPIRGAAPADGQVDLGESGVRWKDGYFSGLVNTLAVQGIIEGGYGLSFNQSGEKSIVPIVGGAAVGGQVSLGTATAGRAFKDGHFSGTIYGTVADVPAHVKAITPTQIANWDAGTGGGGGATTDGRISDTQIIHWDQAYSWGNHASAGYQPAGDYLTPASLNGYATEAWVTSGYQPKGSYLTSSSLTGYATESWVNSQGFAKGSFVPTSGNSTIIGVLTATDFVASSDERLKDNISPMPVGLIDDIKPVQWTWKDSGKKSAGVIAQQLQEIGLDDFVTEGEDGMLGVNYNALVSVLLAEVISLKKELAK